MKDIKKYDFVDALRGWAILGVLFVHTELWVTPPNSMANIVRDGARGVQLFFVASAFTLFLSMSSRKRTENKPNRNFFIRRFFRIAPLFYLSILFWLLKDGFAPRFWAPDGVNLSHVIATLTFTHGWHPEYTNAIVPIGWSLAVEMNFYLLVPIFFRLIVNLRKATIFTLLMLVSCIIISYTSKHLLLPSFPDRAKDIAGRFFDVLWFPAELPIFGCGFILYFLFRNYHDRLAQNQQLSKRLTLASVIVMLLLTPVRSPLVIYAYGGLFVAFAFSLSAYPVKLFVNKIVCQIGTVSYSMYLIHIALLYSVVWRFPRTVGIWHCISYLVAYSVLVSFTFLLAWLTYRLVELPGQALGKQIISYLEGDEANKVNQRLN